MKRITVVLWGTGDTSKPRYRLLRDGLRACGVEVVECRSDVWIGADDKTQQGNLGRRLLSLVASYPTLIWKYLKLPSHDCAVVSHPGLLDLFVLAPFARVRRVPLIWDLFLPVYDTVVRDRNLIQARSPFARLLWSIEWLALRLPTRVFLDTETYARRIEIDFGLPEGTIGSVPVGAEDIFFASVRPRVNNGPLKVLFYGQFIPLHGIEYIVSAARQLRDELVDWVIIGDGQEASRIRAELAAVHLPRMTWINHVNYHELVQHLRDADVCLGIFGTSEKASSVIPNKVYQALAAGRPVITRDSPAIRELLDHCPPWTVLVPPGDSGALADALIRLWNAKESGAFVETADAVLPRVDARTVGQAFLEFCGLTVESRS